MDKDELLKLFSDNDGRFIPGIYNYCDRWCERCSFTSRCRVYNMEGEMTDEEKDARNGEFWEKVSENLKLAVEMMTKIAKERGINLREMEENFPEENETEREKEASGHYLSVLSKEYATRNELWTGVNQDLIMNTVKGYRENMGLGIPGGEALNSVQEIHDAVEVIDWYSFQIHVKIMRALQHGEPDPEYDDPVQNDANGSAKVALIATHRSIAAWGVLLSHIEQCEDEILGILVLLEQVKKGILKEFPEVEKFHRPGFDD